MRGPWWIAVAAGLTLLALPMAVAAEDEPTITFVATGTPPLVCGSQASVSALTVLSGTGILVANQTGVPAAIDVGKKKVVQVSPGQQALVRLNVGQHEVSLIPDCAVITSVDVVAVTVLPAEAPPPASPTPGPSVVVTTSAAPDPGLTGTGGPTADRSGSVGPAAGRTTSGTGTDPAGPRASSAAAPGSAGPVAAAPPDSGAPSAEVLDAQPVTLEHPSDPKGVRLLAVIAAICVFGVAVAIIRVIVSQRTSTTVTI